MQCRRITFLLFTFCCIINAGNFSFSQKKERSYYYEKALHFQRINTDSALIYADSALFQAQKTNNFQVIGDCSLVKAKTHLLRGEFDLTVEHALQAHSYFARTNYELGEAKANLLLGQAYSALKKRKKSENCVREAEVYAKKHHLKRMLIEITICKGNSAFQFNQYEKGMDLYYQADRDIQHVDDLYLKAKIKNNIANILVNTGNTDEALKMYRIVVGYYKKLDYPLDELLVLYNIGRQYRAAGNLDSSLYYANLCLNLGLKVHSLEDVTYAYSALCETYKLKGDYKTALDYNELMHIYQDSLQMNANNVQIMRLETEYQLRQNKEIIEKQKSRLKRTRRKTTVALLALLIATGLIVAGSFYFRKSRKLNKALKKSNSEILEQNKTIDQALFEKEILLKEVHHRVKNSLQIISSLLNLQESQLTDETAIEALRNSKTRIQTIALMHQSLYQRGADLGKVKSSNYLKNILSLQLEALSSKGAQPKTAIEVVEQELSMDQAVPLGLIASEIINNAIKHAYTDTTSSPELTLRSRIVDNKFELIISDNGQGFESNDFRNHSSLGLEIVEALNNQLHGEMTCVSSEKGTVFTFLFPIE